MDNEFPTLPTDLSLVKIVAMSTGNITEVDSAEPINELLKNATELTQIPHWRTQQIFKIESLALSNHNTLFIHINEFDFKDGYLVYKDDDVYEMVYFKVNPDDLVHFKNLTIYNIETPQ